jgi:uncharacterized RDD family membrane protein YckC
MRVPMPAPGTPGMWQAMGAQIALTFAGTTCIGWLYYAFMESSEKQATLGKMVMKCVVTDMSGARISFGRATGRFFAKQFLSGICLIGYLMALWSDKVQALHDQIAGTVVLTRPR